MNNLLRPIDAARLLGVSRPTVLRLVRDEGLPAVLLSGGEGRRRILRFDADQLREWIGGRRDRQIAATIEGRRYTRRVEVTQ